MEIRYTGNDEIELPTLRVVVNTGETLELDDETAKALLRMPNWSAVKAEKAVTTNKKEDDN